MAAWLAGRSVAPAGLPRTGEGDAPALMLAALAALAGMAGLAIARRARPAR